MAVVTDLPSQTYVLAQPNKRKADASLMACPSDLPVRPAAQIRPSSPCVPRHCRFHSFLRRRRDSQQPSVPHRSRHPLAIALKQASATDAVLRARLADVLKMTAPFEDDFERYCLQLCQPFDNAGEKALLIEKLREVYSDGVASLSFSACALISIGDVYNVERILRMRGERERAEFLVKWVGDSTPTWYTYFSLCPAPTIAADLGCPTPREPHANLYDVEALHKFLLPPADDQQPNDVRTLLLPLFPPPSNQPPPVGTCDGCAERLGRLRAPAPRGALFAPLCRGLPVGRTSLPGGAPLGGRLSSSVNAQRLR